MNAPTKPRIATDPAVAGVSLAGRLVILGTRMLKLAGELSRRTDRSQLAPDDLAADDALLTLLAEESYRDRRRRARYLPSRLLGEPGWDILLGLYAAAGRGDTVSVSNACTASGAPASTALRWLHHLEVEGMIERRRDTTDARRHYVRLTGAGMARMSAYFEECRSDLVGPIAA